MNAPSCHPFKAGELPNGAPVNVSRRDVLLSSLGITVCTLVIGFGIPLRPAMGRLSLCYRCSRYARAGLSLNPTG